MCSAISHFQLLICMFCVMCSFKNISRVESWTVYLLSGDNKDRKARMIKVTTSVDAIDGIHKYTKTERKVLLKRWSLILA